MVVKEKDTVGSTILAATQSKAHLDVPSAKGSFKESQAWADVAESATRGSKPEVVCAAYDRSKSPSGRTGRSHSS
jgi:hypothetical protein